MAVDIVVRRDGADAAPYKADDVVEALLGDSVPAALSRGTAELEERGNGQKVVDYDVEYRPGIRNGMLIRLRDSVTGELIHGKITGISINGSRGGDAEPFDLALRVTMRIPTEFVVRATG